MPLNSSRVLVFRGGAVGDFVLTIPVLVALREHRPPASVVLYCHERMAGLASACRFAGKVESIDAVGVSRLFVPGSGRSGELAGIVNPGDEVISYINDPDGVVKKNVLQAGAACIAVGGPEVQDGHAADWMAKPLSTLGIPITMPAVPCIQLPERLLETGRKELAGLTGARGTDNVFAMHAGSGSHRKNWPAERFAALARRLRDECGFSVVFTFGEADAAAADALAGRLHEFAAVSGRDLVEVAALIAGCRGYIGNDSGITHLAAAMGVPTVALFGPTNPSVWAPRGPNVLVIRGPGGSAAGMAGIDQDHVFDCVVSHLKGRCPG